MRIDAPEALARQPRSGRTCRTTRCAPRCACSPRSCAVAAVHLHLCRAAAKSRRAELVLIPLLDILQSVPILGFLTFTVVFFMSLFPGRVLGAGAARRSSRSSPARPGTWRSACTSRCAPCRSDLDEAARQLPPLRLAALLAARGAVRHARPDLEHHDVDVGRLVLRGRVGGDHRSATPRWKLPGIGSYVALAHRAARHRRDRLRHPGHAGW